MKLAFLPVAALLAVAPIHIEARSATPEALPPGGIEHLEATRRCAAEYGGLNGLDSAKLTAVQACVRANLHVALRFHEDLDRNPPPHPVPMPADLADAERRCQEESNLEKHAGRKVPTPSVRDCATARLSAALAIADISPTSVMGNAGSAALDLARCRPMQDHAARLRCYDEAIDGAMEAAEAARTHQPGGYTRMDLAEFKADKASLVGQSVELSGNLMLAQNVAILQADISDMAPVFIEIDTAPRAQKIEVFRRCMSGCQVVVRGKVGPRSDGAVGVTVDAIGLR